MLFFTHCACKNNTSDCSSYTFLIVLKSHHLICHFTRLNMLNDKLIRLNVLIERDLKRKKRIKKVSAKITHRFAMYILFISFSSLCLSLSFFSPFSYRISLIVASILFLQIYIAGQTARCTMRIPTKLREIVKYNY